MERAYKTRLRLKKGIPVISLPVPGKGWGNIPNYISLEMDRAEEIKNFFEFYNRGKLSDVFQIKF